MGGALLTGWLRALGPGHDYVVVDRSSREFRGAVPSAIPDNYRLDRVSSVEAVPNDRRVDAVVLATKPHQVAEALAGLEHCIEPETVAISIAAGIGIDRMLSATDATRAMVRAMPNIGAMLGHSASAGFAAEGVSPSQKALAEALFKAVGTFVWVSREDDLHAVTALSGSGPAYYFAFCEAMAEAAVAEGLSRDVANALAAGTVVSAGRLLEENPDPAVLRETVTSPNGTTAAGLAALGDSDQLVRMAGKALAAARKRSMAMS